MFQFIFSVIQNFVSWKCMASRRSEWWFHLEAIHFQDTKIWITEKINWKISKNIVSYFNTLEITSFNYVFKDFNIFRFLGSEKKYTNLLMDSKKWVQNQWICTFYNDFPSFFIQSSRFSQIVSDFIDLYLGA